MRKSNACIRVIAKVGILYRIQGLL